MLSTNQLNQLDNDGFLSLGKLLDDSQIAEVNAQIDQLLKIEGSLAGQELRDSKHIRHPTETGVIRLADLVNKGEVFDKFYTHSMILGAVQHVIQDRIKLSSLNYRAALPGFGAQKLHVDWHEAVTSDDFRVCNSIWLLDDFTEENGATRLVPKTHRSHQIPADALDDTNAPHPLEQLLIAPAGTAVVFNSHLWHGGTINNSSLPRRAIHAYYCRYDAPQQVDQKRYILEETRARLDTLTLSLLDV